jgi:hypothetical protein
MFNGNLSTRETEYHSFVSDDLALEAIGMCAYTKSSMSAYLNPNNADVGSYFDDKLNDNKAALLASDTSKLLEKYSIMRFDTDTKKYTLVTEANIFKQSDGTSVTTINSIDTLLTRHNEIQLGDTATSGEAEVIKNIQISLSGCITFRPKLNILNCERTPLVRLYIKNRINNNTSRSLANNGPPMIVAVPSRVTGGKYAYHDTANLPVGVYSNPQHGGASNPANAIASELKLTYNSALGKFESGTQQMLARLLCTVDPAKIKNISDIEKRINEADPEDFIDPNSDLYMSQFETGIAIPLTCENGNPHHFGPNTVGCGEINKKEKILVVNRSPRSFAAGDVVICSQIGGEWIIQGFDVPAILTPSPPKPEIKIGRWSFNKWIANSDSFFRDQNYTTKENGNYLNNTLYTTDLYESKFRYRYYLCLHPELADAKKFSTNPIDIELNDIQKIALININPTIPREEAIEVEVENEKNNYDYIISSYPSDPLYFKKSGNIYFSRTNPYHLDLTIDEFSMQQLTGFWGPVFPDGYNSQQCTNFKRLNSDLFDISKNSIKVNDKQLFDSESNTANLHHIPADIATIGSFDEQKLSSPYREYNGYRRALINNIKTVNTFEAVSNYLALSSGNDVNGVPKYQTEMNGRFFGLDPINTTRITFIPLSLEMATCDYTPDNPAVLDETLKYKWIQDNFKNIYTLTPENVVSRNNFNLYKNLKIGIDTERDGEGPIGGPELLPNTESLREKSNFVGIITAKNTFTGNGSSVSFITKQNFGLPSVLKSTLGRVGNVSVVGGSLYLGMGTGGKEYGYPRWGSSTDNYNSFGTTALHVRIFENWPEEQTIYDGAFFSIFHFNPGSVFENVEKTLVNSGIKIDNWSKTDGSGVLNGLQYERYVDQIKYNVDFRVPTYGHPSDNNIDNRIIPSGSIIDRNGGPKGPLRPESEWQVNTIRRGQLLSKGGFTYYKRVIGLDFNKSKINLDMGSKYETGQQFVLDKGVIIKVDEVGNSGEIKTASTIDRGFGFMPSDFAEEYEIEYNDGHETVNRTVYGYTVTLPTNSGGTPAKFLYQKGIVYEKEYTDEGPLEITQAPVRLTLPSKNGEDRTEGTLTTTINLGSSTKTKFDAFYFFHNDILHTISTIGLIGGLGAFPQYVTLEIGAG